MKDEKEIIEAYKIIKKTKIIDRRLLTSEEHLKLLSQPKVSIVNFLFKKNFSDESSLTSQLNKVNKRKFQCNHNKKKMKICHSRLKFLSSPKLLYLLLTFEKHFNHLDIFHIENFLKRIYEREYLTPREALNSLKIKKTCKKFKTQKLSKGFKNFQILDNENIQIDENCYSVDDFYPGGNSENSAISINSTNSHLPVNKTINEIPKNKESQAQRESEISFLRLSQIKIDKLECEKIFKKFEVFHEEKMQKEKSKKSKKNKQRKSSAKSSKSSLKIKSNIKLKKNNGKDEEEYHNDYDKDEDEDEDEEENDNEMGNLCSNATHKKNPEWNVAWVE